MGQLRRSTLAGRSIALILLMSPLLMSGLPLATGGPVAAPRSPADHSAGSVALGSLVAAWPSHWTLTGTHSEATYVEHITVSRRDTDFTLDIVITAQGSQAGGVWSRSVRVDRSGHIIDLVAHGCGGDCAALGGTRGYLAAAVLLALSRTRRLPAGTTPRQFGARTLLCVDGPALYRAAGMGLTGGTVDLDPCVDPATGAVLAQFSPVLAGFGGPTLDAASVRITSGPPPDHTSADTP